MMIGRTKEANEEIDGDVRPVTSRAALTSRRFKGLKIVRPEPAVWHRKRNPWPLFLRLLRVCTILSNSC